MMGIINIIVVLYHLYLCLIVDFIRHYIYISIIMMDIDNKNKYSNDNFLLGKIGAFIKYHRKNQNKTQKILAHEAGVNRSTLSEFENGKNSNIITLIQILRALDQLSVLDTFEIKETISPLALAKLRKKERQRIRTKKKTIPLSKSDW